MDAFDKQLVVKAETDAEIMDALQGLKSTQAELRAGRGGSVALAFIRAYYDKLPEEVARRLTEIDGEAVAHITQATGLGLTGEALKRFAEKIAGGGAFAQVIREANKYRAKLGNGPLGPDGTQEEGGDNERSR